MRHTVIGRATPSSHPAADPSTSNPTFHIRRTTHNLTRAKVNAQAREIGAQKDRLLDGLSLLQRAQYEFLEDTEWQPLSASQTNQDGWSDIDVSHAGNDYEDLYSMLNANQRTGLPRVVKRSWASRNSAEASHWGLQMPRLINAFLHWRHSGHDSTLAGSNEEQANTPLPESTLDYQVLCIDVFGQSEKTFQSSVGELYANETLIRFGYLATVPLVPHTAISLDCLRLYRALRGRCGALSIESFVRVLCDLHNVHFHKYHCAQFSQAFIVYSSLVAGVSEKLDAALGRDDRDWRMKNHCPPCSYELEGEPRVNPRRMFTMDGRYLQR